ncbi:hypothetical protein ACLOJK_041250 [Asimina triloba]
MEPGIQFACFLATIFFFSTRTMPCQAQLSPSFYDNTCPNALATIRTAVRAAIAQERRMAASLIRLHFHDCFVQGCDASIMLDDSPSIQSEKNAPANFQSARGFDVVENAKSRVESICPGVVGGPKWTVKLGRRDSTTASPSQALTDLPSFAASLETLISSFSSKGLSARDMVALSGAHTLGQARCLTFRGRIYNGTNIDAGFASTRRRGCPSVGGNANPVPLDLVTPNSFDNNYFKNLISKKGLLASDQVLFSGGSTDSIVRDYGMNQATFYSDSAAAMVKMGDITPLTGSNGQIRRACNVVN